ncbi:MAG: 3-oxoacyl-[acyl-carrier-protein] synthase III C-terminal domain-containing protein [Mediterraneibacter gnavus]
MQKAQIRKGRNFLLLFASGQSEGSLKQRRSGSGQILSRFPMNLQEYGNTSAASIPILLDEWNRKGRLQKGDKLILAGFGAGLSWAGSLLEW